MCGRAAQSRHAVRAAEGLFLGRPAAGTTSSNNNEQSTQTSLQHEASAARASEEYEWQDNYNMSPGMSCTIFFRDDDNTVQMDRKVWGLVPKAGTQNNPLPTGMSHHFSNLMFNARSDTLLNKRSFAPLFQKGRTCVLVVDGFFEWTPPPLKGGKKQPYYVYRNKDDESHPFLMFAGLWTSVSTGRNDDPTLDTFTIMTTEACPALAWLHSRMPLCIYDDSLASAWLERPSRSVFKQLDEAVAPPDFFQWHAVTTEMNSTKYRSQDAIKALPPQVSVKSYFTAASSSPESNQARIKSPAKKVAVESIASSSDGKQLASSSANRQAVSSSPGSRKRKAATTRKGPMDSFSSPKAKK